MAYAHLKYHPQLKTKEDVEGGGKLVTEGSQEKHGKQGYGCYTDASHLSSPTIRIL